MNWVDERPVLVAPDAFKGTFSAVEVAEAIAAGIESTGILADRCPIADGGEGTADVLCGALGGDVRDVEVTGPLGDAVVASFTLLERPASGKSRGSRTAVLDMASASGLPLVPEGARDPLVATSVGTGELISAAIDAGAELVLVACGGSATVDGGAGAIEALTNGGGLRGAKLTCLVDVQTTWERCAAVFGPQKGASPEGVAELEVRLAALAATLPNDPRGIPGGGAAGGLAGGLHAAFGAAIEPGAPFVLTAVGADARMRAARFVIVGEGQLDRTSLQGKAPGELATRSRQAGVPCHAVVGRNALDLFGGRILDLMEILEATTLDELAAAGKLLATRWLKATASV
ncbi:MAG: glycerate kinase [Solirubrobacteraceae bacterium]|nr:glycerate kinase [Solirubrobacteraceae bacterium]